MPRVAFAATAALGGAARSAFAATTFSSPLAQPLTPERAPRQHVAALPASARTRCGRRELRHWSGVAADDERVLARMQSVVSRRIPGKKWRVPRCEIPHYSALPAFAYDSGAMNTAVLIESLVRQTTVLIATLATAAGQRAQLSRVADQVFGDLVRVLNEQGVGHKVIADMFGMALRTYHERVSRLAASSTDQGRSLWEAIFSHIEQHGPVSRVRLLHRFKKDDEATVRGVLRDLVESALVYQTGRGDETSYRTADPKEVLDRNRHPETLDRLLQVAIYRSGPVERSKLSEIVPIGDDALLDASLARMVAAREVHEDTAGPVPMYDCETCVIAFGDPAGWEAAVFDHYQAMVTALVTKLRLGKRRADLSDKIGGSTFVFHLRPDHPMASEVLGFLRAMREAGMGLRKRLDEYDEAHPPAAGSRAMRVVSYVGQSVQEEEADDRD